MGLEIIHSGQTCGATVRGLDLSAQLDAEMVEQLRTLWLEHQVLSFPAQDLDDDELERFTQYFGPFGDDPYIKPIPNRSHIAAICRVANEQAPLFANQYAALDAMPEALRSRLEDTEAIHSARGGYAPDGAYGEADQRTDRSMDIISSEQALDTQLHPIIRTHDETGRLGLFGCVGYVIGIEGMDEGEANDLLAEWYYWQTRDEFVYSHAWEPDMLIMWDNRSLLHRATGGYDGHDRLLHRTTIGAYSRE